MRQTLLMLAMAVALGRPAVARAQMFAGRALADSSRAPLWNIVVELIGPSGTIAETHTDSAGEFYLTAPGAGRYRLLFRPVAAEPQLSSEMTIAADEFHTREYVVRIEQRAADRVYFEFQVEKVVTQRPNSRAPAYPPELRARRISGEVLMQYVVDTLGRVEPGTIRVLRSSHPEFDRAVREALPFARFTPAENSGHKVRQLVQQPFVFAIAP
jgi:TonB family protein